MFWTGSIKSSMPSTPAPGLLSRRITSDELNFRTSMGFETDGKRRYISVVFVPYGAHEGADRLSTARIL